MIKSPAVEYGLEMAYFLKNRLKGFPSSPAGPIFLALLMIILAGCAATPKASTALYPILGEKTAEMQKMGYKPHGRFWSFTNAEVVITVRHVTQDNIEPTYIDVVDELAAKGYIFLKLDIKNLSNRINITFNPALTSLTTNSLDYKKPLDYTDFYDFVKESVGAQAQLGALSSVIYDNTQTIKSSQTASKFLIFPPLSKDFTTADLVITDLYIHTKPYALSFPFQLQKLNDLLP
ncbi:MAG: hypothetical protein HZB82_08600 [Deltaproteobacteria bacterium]|nr:hypothetical protein [Deltaproteobacteria bacterium]